MSNSSCSFSTIEGLLAHLIRDSTLNVTAQVALCSDICLQAWGSGNPDLSGIGLNLSYLIQATLTIICGPLLGAIYVLRRPLRLDRTTVVAMSSIHDNFLDTSAAFNIPVAIAAAIRTHHFTPFYELAFLQFLILMQAHSFLLVVAIIGLFERPHRRSLRRLSVVILYLLINFSLCIEVVVSALTNPMNGVLGKELNDACKSYIDVLPVSSQAILGRGSGDHAHAHLMVELMAGIVLFIIVILRVSVLQRLTRKWKWRRWTQPLTAILIFPLLAGLLIGWIFEMQRTRNEMKAIIGAVSQDDQWSFGQIVAVFLWLPLCFQILLHVMDRVMWSVFPEFMFILDQILLEVSLS